MKQSVWIRRSRQLQIIMWNKTTSQNYGKYDIDNSTYQIWLEDAQSVAEKVKLVSKYDLAGVSAWKLGFENNGIWQVISDNLNN